MLKELDDEYSNEMPTLKATRDQDDEIKDQEEFEEYLKLLESLNDMYEKRGEDVKEMPNLKASRFDGAEDEDEQFKE